MSSRHRLLRQRDVMFPRAYACRQRFAGVSAATDRGLFLDQPDGHRVAVADRHEVAHTRNDCNMRTRMAVSAFTQLVLDDCRQPGPHKSASQFICHWTPAQNKKYSALPRNRGVLALHQQGINFRYHTQVLQKVKLTKVFYEEGYLDRQQRKTRLLVRCALLLPYCGGMSDLVSKNRADFPGKVFMGRETRSQSIPSKGSSVLRN
jgi:hypothetical protein